MKANIFICLIYPFTQIAFSSGDVTHFACARFARVRFHLLCLSTFVVDASACLLFLPLGSLCFLSGEKTVVHTHNTGTRLTYFVRKLNNVCE
jgi:hypothetical protein